MNSRFFIFIFILVACGFSASAQKILKGIVVDSVTLSGIPNVSVRLLRAGYGTITNANGVFSIRVKTTDTLSFSSVGYLRIIEPVITDDEIMFVRMVQEVILLKEVTVYGRPEAIKKELPSLKLKSKALPWGGALPNSGGGAAINLDFFSKREREKRKLAKLKAELASTQTYVEIVTNLEVIQELKDRYSLNDSSFYKILTHFNEQHREITHSGNQADILISLFSFFDTEIRFRRARH
ncbi:MAG: carboxypeptidase-like regulatory domain-containing protein [Bacteroidetes bacterium]|nr:carboxypeptidase-like regulatory domain-containing protein [Bacteroidota bacterium]